MLALNPHRTTAKTYHLHVDIDSFFASVESREKPELAGLPIVVGVDPKRGKGRGVSLSWEYNFFLYFSPEN